jgi:phospholipid/cholesterol/gamma-HCH transport system permease protein
MAGAKVLGEVGRVGKFWWTTVRWMFTHLPEVRSVVDQMIRIGLMSLPVILAVCAFVGSNIVLVGFYAFQDFGGQDMVGAYSGLMSIREFAPIIVGAMMAAKPGTEMTATIATMRIKEQIDALEVMAVNPYGYLMAPRFLAFMLVAPMLIIFADVAAVFAGWLVAVFQLGVNSGAFMADVTRFLTFDDVLFGMVKGMLFALLTCVVSCYFGYTSGPGPQGVSRAINRAVVTIATLIVVLNYFLSEVMWG